MDLRSRIVQAVEVEGISRRGAAERFMVCPSTAIKLLKHKETTGGVAPKKIGGRLHNLEPHRDMLRAIVEETPDMTLERIANEVVARGGLRVGKSSVDRMLKHMGFRIKKKPDRRRADPH
jgi:putative transposase